MYIAQDVIINSPPPWWTVGSALGAALLAGLIATAGWYVVHRTSKNRDFENWRRLTLTTSVSELISASNERSVAANNYTIGPVTDIKFLKLYPPLRTLASKISQNNVQLEICQVEKIHAVANTIDTLHLNNAMELLKFTNGSRSSENPPQIDQKHLQALHRMLIDETTAYLRLPRKHHRKCL